MWLLAPSVWVCGCMHNVCVDICSQSVCLEFVWAAMQACIYVYAHIVLTCALCACSKWIFCVALAELGDRDQQQPCFSSSCWIWHDLFSSKILFPNTMCSKMTDTRHQKSYFSNSKFEVWQFVVFCTGTKAIIYLIADLDFS